MKGIKLKSIATCMFLIVCVVCSFCVTAFAENLGVWETKENMLTATSSANVSAVNEKLYVMGGYNDGAINTVQEYNPLTNSWTLKASMQVARHGLCGNAVNGKIYAISGADNNGNVGTVEEYNPTTDTWTSKSNIITPRYYASSSVYNGKIYVIGGCTTTQTNAVEMYDPVTNTWTSKESMPTARYSLGVATANNKIYAIGGSNGTSLNTVEEYDPETGVWATKASMPTPKHQFAIAVLNNKIYVIGGSDTNNNFFSSVEVYDPATDIWSTTTSLPEVRGGNRASVIDNKIFVAGGGSQYMVVMDSFLQYSITVNPPSNPSVTSENMTVTFTWDAVSDATSYNVKRSTTSGGPYTTIASNITGTTFTDNNVSDGVTYYYVVTAINSNGESTNSSEVSVTPQQPTVNRAILVITMTNSFEKEYDLSSVEIEAFINWYDQRAMGVGKAYYIFNKAYNLGPFATRKEYIVFDKILSFEINEYVVTN